MEGNDEGRKEGNSKEESGLEIIIDILASEYGWTVKYIMDLPYVQIKKLAKAIQKRIRNNLAMEITLMTSTISLALSNPKKAIDLAEEISKDIAENKQTGDVIVPSEIAEAFSVKTSKIKRKRKK